MFRHRIAARWVTFCLVIAAASYSAPQESSIPVKRIADLINRLGSLEWRDRAEAFYALVRPGSAAGPLRNDESVPAALADVLLEFPHQADAIKLTLFQLLATENSRRQKQNAEMKASGALWTEDYTAYYGDLIAAVTSLKDVRSLNAVLGCIATGNMATSTLASFGDAAVDPVIGKLSDPDPIVRTAAAAALGEMLSAQALKDPSSRPKLKQAFLSATRDENPFARRRAVEGLGKIGDRDTIPVLEALAVGDPYEASQHGGERGWFPVREAAARVLQTLRSKARE